MAEEARNVCVENEQWFLVDEVLPQVTGMTKPGIEPVSWSLEEELGQLAEVTREGPSRVAPEKYEAGHMMQWPDDRWNHAGIGDVSGRFCAGRG